MTKHNTKIDGPVPNMICGSYVEVRDGNEKIRKAVAVVYCHATALASYPAFLSGGRLVRLTEALADFKWH